MPAALARPALLTAALALTTGACRRGAADAPPCGAVGATFFALARAELDRAPPAPDLHRAVEVQLPAMRDALVHACTDGAWAGPVRACLVAARDRAAFEACAAQLTDAQRQALDRAARGEDGAAPPR